MSSTIRVLPPELRPGQDVIRRRHKPEPGKYADYTDCLRWEFGFICAFCLLHETDIIKHGAKGTGMMWVEHLHPQSTTGKHRRDQYSNCYYSCRFCNNRRRAKPVGTGNQRLLDPCVSPWAAHFDLANDALVPRSANGEYTAKAYRVNDPRKRKMRGHRRARIPLLLQQIETVPSLLVQLVERLSRTRGEARQECLRHIKVLRSTLAAAKDELASWTKVPDDPPSNCRCRRAGSEKKRAARRRMPKMYADQAIPVRVP